MYVEIGIPVCGKHKHKYPTPLINTTKFGDRYFAWCPHCGKKYKFFDDYIYMNCPKVNKRLELFESLAEKYLSGEESKFSLRQKPDSI